MTDVLSLLDASLAQRVAKNAVPILPSITFSYLYLQTQIIWLLVATLVALFFLAFYLNLFERIQFLLPKKVLDKQYKSDEQLGMAVFGALFKNKSFTTTMLLSVVLAIISFAVLCFYLEGIVAWTLFLLNLFAFFHYITAFIVYWCIMKSPK